MRHIRLSPIGLGNPERRRGPRARRRCCFPAPHEFGRPHSVTECRTALPSRPAQPDGSGEPSHLACRSGSSKLIRPFSLLCFTKPLLEHLIRSFALAHFLFSRSTKKCVCASQFPTFFEKFPKLLSSNLRIFRSIHLWAPSGPFCQTTYRRLLRTHDAVTRCHPAGGYGPFAPWRFAPMFRLLRRSSRSQAPAALRPVRLFLEALEDRNSPTAISLSVAYNANHQVTLSGQVTVDGTGYHGSTSGVSGMTIIISGAAAGTTETDGDGYYSVTLTADFLGQVNAQTADYTSNIASAT